MRRDPRRLALESYDLVVVGGGIYGACAAWEGARRGLKTALIDAGDFGHATSSNSLRTLHGGLRHLQRFDFPNMRESVVARREWLRFAPHLTHPLRFVLPTAGHGLRSPQVLRAALWVNDLVSSDRNRGVATDRMLPGSSVWGAKLARAILSGTHVSGCNGAAIWYDAVCSNTERLLIAVISAAVMNGAHAVNYVRATGLKLHGGSVAGVRVRDELSGEALEIRTRAVINATGPWIADWLDALPGVTRRLDFRPSRAFNLLTRPLPFREGMGFSVPVARGAAGAQTYFVLPWNGRSLIGTRHLRCVPGAGASNVISREEVAEFLHDLNHVLGAYRLHGSDVVGVFAGLLPEREGASGEEVELERSAQIIDHDSDGARGLFSVIGVKWTTSRVVARRAVSQARAFLRSAGPMARSAALQPTRADVHAPGDLRGSSGGGARSGLDPATLVHLNEMYGPGFMQVLRLLDEDGGMATRIVPDLPVLTAQVVQAVREEMAVRLDDIVMRRTPLFLSEALDGAALSLCAATAARELRWGKRETASQIERAEAALQAFRGPFWVEPVRTLEVPAQVSIS
jgi:glycerol-3-phosphate dehydrogenase